MPSLELHCSTMPFFLPFDTSHESSILVFGVPNAKNIVFDIPDEDAHLCILEALMWISLGDAFQFLQCIILLKNHVLNSNSGYDHFNILLNSFFSQFITHGTYLLKIKNVFS